MNLFFMVVIGAAGWALPLENHFIPSECNKFLRATIEAGTYQGQIYSMPSRIDCGMLYARDLFLECLTKSLPGLFLCWL